MVSRVHNKAFLWLLWCTGATAGGPDPHGCSELGIVDIGRNVCPWAFGENFLRTVASGPFLNCLLKDNSSNPVSVHDFVQAMFVNGGHEERAAYTANHATWHIFGPSCGSPKRRFLLPGMKGMPAVICCSPTRKRVCSITP